MAYTKNPTWQDGVAGGTRIDAAPLNRIEDGIEAAAANADTAVSGLAGKANTSHTHVSANITDATATGQALLTAADAPAARAAIGAANSSHVHGSADIASGVATDGFALTADGAGGSAWEVLPAGDHGLLTGLADDDHTQYALANGTRGSFAAPLGADDNYVTDAEKVKLTNLSGTNTGDQDLSSYLTTAAAPELIRDTMGTALVAGTGVTITPDDVADTITIAASGGGSSGPPLVSGSWYEPPASVLANIAMTDGRIYYAPLDIPAACTVDRIAIAVQATGTATLARVGIYSGSTGQPGELILDAGTVSVAAVAQVEATVSQALSAGRVWLCVVAQGGTVTLRGASGNLPGVPVFAVSTTNTNAGLQSALTALTTGALPATALLTATTLLARPNIAVRIA